MLAALLGGLASADLSTLATSHRDVIRELRSCDPIKTAATFAGLLTRPEIQANCVRLEALVHLALIHCRGRG